MFSKNSLESNIETSQNVLANTSLIYIFTQKEFFGGFKGKDSASTFYGGLGAMIHNDFTSLGCLNDYKSFAGMDISTPDDSPTIYAAIISGCGKFWGLIRYDTPLQMKANYDDKFLPAYKSLMQNGRESSCEELQLPKHNILSIEFIVAGHHVCNKTAEMLRTIDPSYRLKS